MVPKNWIKSGSKENDYLCKYPDPKYYKFVDAWVRGESDPVESWKEFSVNVETQASKFKAYNNLISL